MLLSELKTGSSAVVVKVLGHGGFRRRILEMGFVRGQRVVSVLNAPLRDPIKYRIMGYEVSLRRSEADKIEVVNLDDVSINSSDYNGTIADDVISDVIKEKTNNITVALVGEA